MKTLHVTGLRWFSRAKGHTYHRAIVIFDGRTIVDSPVTYGYGNQFLETAAEACEAAGVISRKPHESLYRACERAGIAFTSEVRDVERRRDLGTPAVQS